MHVGECPDNFSGGDGVWRCSVLFVAPHSKESVVACNVRFASLLVYGLVLNLVKNPCRSEHATILSVLNIMLLDVKTPQWLWTSSRACVNSQSVPRLATTPSLACRHPAFPRRTAPSHQANKIGETPCNSCTCRAWSL